MSKPNILLVVPRMNIGGAESYVLTLAQGFHRKQFNITVASWGGMLTKELKKSGIRHYRIPIRLNARLAGSMWNI